MLLPEQSATDAVLAMDRVRRQVEKLAFPTPAGKGVLTISVGVAALRRNDKHPSQWLAHADRALYVAKAKGRNRVESADRPAKRAA